MKWSYIATTASIVSWVKKAAEVPDHKNGNCSIAAEHELKQ